MVRYLASIFKLNRSILIYILSNSSIGLIAIGVNAVLFNLYLIQLGLDLSFVGSLNALGSIVFAVLALPAGWVGSRFGLRGSIIAGFIIVSFFLAALLFVDTLPRPAWEAGFLVVYSLLFIGAPLVTVNGGPYLMVVSAESERSQAFAFSAALFSLMAFLGSLAAGFLPGLVLQVFGQGMGLAAAYKTVLALGVPIYAGAGLIMFKARPAPRQEQAAAGERPSAAPAAMLGFLVLLFILQFAAENSVMMFLNVYFAQNLLLASAVIGVIFAVARLAPFLLSPLQPLLINRWGPGASMAFSYVLLAAAALSMAFFPAWGIAAAGFLFASIISSFTGTARTLYALRSVEPRWHTMASAMIIISLAGGGALVGFGGAALIKAIGYQGLFFTGAGLSLLVILLYNIWQRRPAPVLARLEPDPAPPEPEITP